MSNSRNWWETPRAPAGIPEGGEWRTKPRARPDVTLDPAADPWGSDSYEAWGSDSYDPWGSDADDFFEHLATLEPEPEPVPEPVAVVEPEPVPEPVAVVEPEPDRDDMDDDDDEGPDLDDWGDAETSAPGHASAWNGDELDLTMDPNSVFYDPEAAAERAREKHWESVMADVDKAASRWARVTDSAARSGGRITREDLVQEGVMAVLSNGETVANPVSFASGVARNIATRAGNESVSNTDRAALSKLATWSREFEQEHARRPTQHERRAEALRVREAWPDQRHRPSAQFYLLGGQLTTVLDDVTQVPSAGLDGASLTQTGSLERFSEGSFAERALDAAEGIDGNRKTAKSLLWNAMAELSDDAPLVERAHLGPNAITLIRADVEAAGGVLNVVARGREGHLDPALDRLLAPWGDDLSARERDAIFDLLERRSDFAEEMWRSALLLANTRHSQL